MKKAVNDMNTKQLLNRSAGIAGCLALGVLAMSTVAAPKLKVRILQTNSAGDSVTVIDPLTNKVVGEIAGIEANHGVAIAPDGNSIYISDEAENTLDVADGRTLEVLKHIPLSG